MPNNEVKTSMFDVQHSLFDIIIPYLVCSPVITPNLKKPRRGFPFVAK